MKVETTKEKKTPKEFTPFAIKIIFENEREVRNFLTRIDISDRLLAKQTSIPESSFNYFYTTISDLEADHKNGVGSKYSNILADEIFKNFKL